MGKFDKMREGEGERKKAGKRNKFLPLTGAETTEKERSMNVLKQVLGREENLGKNKGKSHADEDADGEGKKKKVRKKIKENECASVATGCAHAVCVCFIVAWKTVEEHHQGPHEEAAKKLESRISFCVIVAAAATVCVSQQQEEQFLSLLEKVDTHTHIKKHVVDLTRLYCIDIKINWFFVWDSLVSSIVVLALSIVLAQRYDVEV